MEVLRGLSLYFLGGFFRFCTCITKYALPNSTNNQSEDGLILGRESKDKDELLRCRAVFQGDRRACRDEKADKWGGDTASQYIQKDVESQSEAGSDIDRVHAPKDYDQENTA